MFNCDPHQISMMWKVSSNLATCHYYSPKALKAADNDNTNKFVLVLLMIIRLPFSCRTYGLGRASTSLN